MIGVNSDTLLADFYLTTQEGSARMHPERMNTNKIFSVRMIPLVNRRLIYIVYRVFRFVGRNWETLFESEVDEQSPLAC